MIKKFSKAIAALAVASLLIVEASPLATTAYAAEEAGSTDVVAEETAELQSEDDAELLATVSYSSLGQVTGLAYNSTTEYLTWNKVANADEYVITVKATYYGESYYNSRTYTTDDCYYSFSPSEGYTYLITVRAVSNDEYIVATNVSSDDLYSKYTTDSSDTTKTYYESYLRVYDGSDYYYTLYLYPEGAESSAISVSGSSDKVESTTQVSAAPTIKFKECYTGDYGYSYYVFSTTTTPVNLTYEDEYIVWEFSNNSSFAADGKDNWAYRRGVATTDASYDYYNSSYKYSYDGDTGEVYFYPSSLDLNPGDTLYVRCRVYNPNYEYTWVDENSYLAMYGSYSNVASVKVDNLTISYCDTYATASSITLDATEYNGMATGFVFQKKVGKKWITVAKQTSPTYKYSKLTKNTKYALRVRAYYYNETSKKTTYSDYYYVNAYTWAANLTVKAAAKSSKAVKLTWKKVSGADGYEVYRCDASASSQTISNGVYTTNYSAYTLVKTLGKKKKSYTDKKLTAGMTYYYLVRAYKTIGGKKIYIDSYTSITLKASSISITDQYLKSNGQTVVKWQKMTGISGYYVEKYNTVTGMYEKVATLSKSKTSYTFAKVNVGSSAIQYRIRPYKGTNVYGASYVTVEPTLATVTGVKATTTSEGIKVTWNAVSGADYYVVYRTTGNDFIYNKTTKTYTSDNSNVSVVQSVNISRTGYDATTGATTVNWALTYTQSQITGTSVVDLKDDVTYEYADEYDETTGKYTTDTETYYESTLEEGVTYYYYVVAYASPTSGKVSYDANSTYSSSEIASAGVSKAASATITSTKKASAIKAKKISVKSKKSGQVTVSVSGKKASGVVGYAIYRATKKKGTYVLVGITTSKSFTDTSATSGKTYYYKVAAVKENEAKAYVYGAKSSPKSVTVK